MNYDKIPADYDESRKAALEHSLREFKRDNVPPVLYKYRGEWDESNQKETLTQDLIYFSSPSQLNDPFDLKVFPDPRRLAKQWVGFRMAFHQKRGLGENEARTRALHDYTAQGVGTPEWLQTQLDVFRSDIESRLAIYCLSKVSLNLLMWSHYSSSHRGFCIGYNSLALCKSTIDGFVFDDKIRPCTRPSTALLKVEYHPNYPNIEIDLELADNLSRNKSEDWRYEKEWRLTQLATPTTGEEICEKWNIPSDVITEIIMGCRMPPSQREQLIAHLRTRESKVNLFEAVKEDFEFRLSVRPVNY